MCIQTGCGILSSLKTQFCVTGPKGPASLPVHSVRNAQQPPVLQQEESIVEHEVGVLGDSRDYATQLRVAVVGLSDIVEEVVVTESGDAFARLHGPGIGFTTSPFVGETQVHQRSNRLTRVWGPGERPGLVRSGLAPFSKPTRSSRRFSWLESEDSHSRQILPFGVKPGVRVDIFMRRPHVFGSVALVSARERVSDDVVAAGDVHDGKVEPTQVLGPSNLPPG
ncbi:hypothetical protein BDV93DRAFT_516761 [Ceratobasidium sp. AG-I]|nr:hypothetical protein BDV93DRAFT_516761 [Ceratobasidium sp. AG-I]